MRGTHPERALEQTIERGEAIRAGTAVLAACSGGADSVALAGALCAVAPRMHLRVTLGHVNHGARPSAWQDECVVLCIGAALGVPVKVRGLEIPGRDEASLREARYAALAEMARDSGATTIATAHHAEDQSETVLLALFRGAGPEGLSGIPERRPLDGEFELARPLLHAASETLREYCHLRALPYAVDPTNADREIRRNAVREALEALRPLFPGLDEAVARAAALVGAERAGTERASLRRKVRDALADQESLRDVDFEHIEAAVRALQRGASGRFHMKAGVTIEVESGRLSAIVRDSA
ncbi:MAG: tRNA lysidine(34) synthetase TilS [Vulcanimicrobiaceae bacterium]